MILNACLYSSVFKSFLKKTLSNILVDFPGKGIPEPGHYNGEGPLPGYVLLKVCPTPLTGFHCC